MKDVKITNGCLSPELKWTFTITLSYNESATIPGSLLPLNLTLVAPPPLPNDETFNYNGNPLTLSNNEITIPSSVLEEDGMDPTVNVTIGDGKPGGK